MKAVSDDAAFRRFVRGWFQSNTPDAWRVSARNLSESEQIEWQREWLRVLSGPGFHAPHVPKDFGGGGYNLPERAVIYQEWARADAPNLSLYSVSLHHMPSTLLRAGTAQQRDKYIRRGLDGVIWCQGFSEPEAGSDLAALRSTAVRSTDRDGYVINGRKIWSSHAAHAQHCLLLVRTSNSGPKHAGITYVIADMTSSGVEVRPIKQSTGQEEFCEVTFDDVFVPTADRIGDEGEGWQIAQSTLSAERGPLALEIVERIDMARQCLRDGLRAGMPGDVIGREDDEVMLDMTTRSLALRSMALDMIETMSAPGAERGRSLSSVVKVASSDLMRQVVDYASLCDGLNSMTAEPHTPGTSWFSGHWIDDFINSWGWSISAGSNEIQRNIIARRVLKMPKE